MIALHPEPRRCTWACLICEHPLAAVSVRGLHEAAEAHVAYLNAVADRTLDEHYAIDRLDRLLADVAPVLD